MSIAFVLTIADTNRMRHRYQFVRMVCNGISELVTLLPNELQYLLEKERAMQTITEETAKKVVLQKRLTITETENIPKV